MHKHLAWGLLALVVIGLVAFFYPRKVHEPMPQPVQLPEAAEAVPAPTPSADTPPMAQEPEPEPEFMAEPAREPPAPLPPLDESDAEARAALAAATGETLVTEHVAASDLIRKLVAAENPRKPLSDSKLAQLLEDQGIQVARRTIAKYRDSLSIPPSNERKRLV